MVHSKLGSSDVRVHLVLEKYISDLTTKHGQGNPRFEGFLASAVAAGHCLCELATCGSLVHRKTKNWELKGKA